MLDRKVDVNLSNMSSGMSVFLVISSDMAYSLVVEVKLVLGLHGVREARHSLIHRTHGTDDTIQGGFHKESGARGICSKEVSLIIVV